MDKDTAAAINTWLKKERQRIAGHRDPYSRGYRQAVQYFSEVVKAALAGDLEKLKDI